MHTLLRTGPLAHLLGLALALASARVALAAPPPFAGPLPQPVSEAFASGALGLPAPSEGLPTSAVAGDWIVPIVRVSFTDSALVHGPAALEQALFDTTGSNPDGSFSEYYRWASGGRLRVRGRVVATVALHHDRFYYSFESYGLATLSTPNNAAGLVNEAVRAADPVVDWSEFDRDGDGYVDLVWIVHAGPGAETTGQSRDMWSITSQLSAGWSNSGAVSTQDPVRGSPQQRMRVDRFGMLPELSGLRPGQPTEIGIFCHEFGHALGLPDLYDTSALGGGANVGPGVWSLMSTGTYGGDGRSPQRPTHLGAWPLLFLGWAERHRVQADTTIQLTSVASGGPVLEFWSNGEAGPEHYLIEHRERTGFDRDLPAAGALLVHVDEALVGLRLGSNRVNVGPFPALRVVEGDGRQDMMRGLNRGDAGDALPGETGLHLLDDESIPPLRSLRDATTNLSILNIVPWPGSTSLDLHVLPIGWAASAGPPTDATAPQSTLSPATRIARGSAGEDVLVGTELRDGVTRVVLRAFTGGSFGPALSLDDDAAPGSEPSVAALPGGDVVAVWRRGPSGAGRIVVRTRIAGQWLPPVILSPATQTAAAPSVSADGAGRVSVVWLGRESGGEPRVWLARFLYTSPFAQPVPISTAAQVPGEPLVVSDRRGPAYVIWSERSVFPAGLFHVRCHPDSQPSAPLRLANPTGSPQLGFGAAVDTAGALHTVWHVSGLGVSEIHWQRRPWASPPMPRDTVVDSRGDGLRDPCVSADPHGHVHATWLRQRDWGNEVRYNRWRIGRGWDAQSTPISQPDEGSSERPVLVGRGAEEVTVVWLANVQSAPVERSRSRSPNSGLLGSPASGPAGPVARLAPTPNPVRAGQLLALAGAVPFEAVEVFDALGRRVALATADATGHARVPGDVSRSWHPGIYFARGAVRGARARFVVLH